MRITIEAAGRRVLDLELMAPLRRSAAVPARETSLGGDPHSTVSAQVEQASEPAPGFGFRGSAATIMCGEPSPGGILCRFPPGEHSHSWDTWT